MSTIITVTNVSPAIWGILQAHRKDPAAALGFLSRHLEAFGVERIYAADGSLLLAYVNRGDPYDATVLYDPWENEYLWEAWGDWFERHETAGDIVLNFDGNYERA